MAAQGGDVLRADFQDDIVAIDNARLLDHQPDGCKLPYDQEFRDSLGSAGCGKKLRRCATAEKGEVLRPCRHDAVFQAASQVVECPPDIAAESGEGGTSERGR